MTVERSVFVAYSFLAIIMLVLCVLAVAIAIRILLGRNWFLGWLRGSLGFGLILIAVAIGLLAWDLHSYEELTRERNVAHISFAQEDEQLFTATLTEPNGRARKFTIAGDMWQLDARILRWNNTMARLGLQPGLRLDRLSGRYFAIEQEQNDTKSVHNLGPENSLVDTWQVVKKYSDLLPLLKSMYGSATYLPMKDGALFSVTLSSTGLVGQPLNEPAEQAVSSWE